MPASLVLDKVDGETVTVANGPVFTTKVVVKKVGGQWRPTHNLKLRRAGWVEVPLRPGFILSDFVIDLIEDMAVTG